MDLVGYPQIDWQPISNIISMPARNRRALPKPEVGDSIHLLIDIVKNHIETCLKKHLSMAETVECMWSVHGTPSPVTSICELR
uniref:Uncharacterized protein n=1 Tax=Kalanchoe fedtschenkoi TaxID=63787 RepID=A0A7N0T3M7_KALFE